MAVSVGPGSFTGLRVGVTAAKVFAYCVGAEVMGISTLETIAAGVPGANFGAPTAGFTASQEAHPLQRVGVDEATELVSEVSVVLDAQRGDVVVQSFAPGSARRGTPRCGRADFGRRLARPARPRRRGDGAGPGAAGRLPAAGGAGVAPCDWSPRAAVVGRLAARDYARGRRDDLWKLAPRYFRRSAAEEKWDAMGR